MSTIEEIMNGGGTSKGERYETNIKSNAKIPPQKKSQRESRSFPANDIEESLKIPTAIANYNAGNPWNGIELAKALGAGEKSSTFYYLTVSSRDYGFTTGTSKSTVALTPLGRSAVYPQEVNGEIDVIRKAFFNIELFQKVFDYYSKNDGYLAEERFASNVLKEKFNLDSTNHQEFFKIYKASLDFINKKNNTRAIVPLPEVTSTSNITATLVNQNKPTGTRDLFIIMPFSEKTVAYPAGYFDEVYSSLIVPAAAQAGFTALNANRNGTDIIQKTIVNSIFNADLILVDLTEHNPNVLFELGLAIAFNKKVVIMRAKGTKAIFDVDNAMRVLDYDSKLWKSTIEMDITKLAQHIEETSKSSEKSYLDIFLDK